MYWEPDKECMDREELEQLQLERLQSTLNRVYAHVPFYRKKFDALGVTPEEIGSLSDLSRLPFTTKEDVRGNYPYGLFAVPLREVVRIHASSGTTETSSVMGYTRNDIAMWSKLVARILGAIRGLSRKCLVLDLDIFEMLSDQFKPIQRRYSYSHT